MPLGGAPSGTVTADVVLVDRATAAKGIAGLFSDEGVSGVAGHAVLLPRGVLSDDTVEEATSAGALAVLVDGPLPAGAFSLDVPPGVPVVGLADGVVARDSRADRRGHPGDGGDRGRRRREREAGGSIAAFSSRGLAFDGSLKPISPRRASRCPRPSRAAETRERSASGRSAGRAPRRR